MNGLVLLWIMLFAIDFASFIREGRDRTAFFMILGSIFAALSWT